MPTATIIVRTDLDDRDLLSLEVVDLDLEPGGHAVAYLTGIASDLDVPDVETNVKRLAILVEDGYPEPAGYALADALRGLDETSVTFRRGTAVEVSR